MSDTHALAKFIERHPRLLVLTGAGCSTESGIPDYRDRDGEWKRKQPIQFQDFVRSETMRKRYWARSMVGWVAFGAATPGQPHRVLAAMEHAGLIHHLITQNVDRLHQRAGSQAVIDLHGRLDNVECLDCGAAVEREVIQRALEVLNPDWTYGESRLGPDGDVDLEDADYNVFEVAACSACGGMLKPSVVFFGEQVPRERVDACYARLSEADALLVVGSSLMVFSGYRFVRASKAADQPVAALNLGRTRADLELDLKVERLCGEALAELAQHLGVALTVA
jgi:NAD-dependent SIR2 family protein deacetylase